MLVSGTSLKCRPNEAVYLENLADRPERRQALWQDIRRGRIIWTDRVVPEGSLEIPFSFRNTLETQFAFRFLTATKRWELFATVEPHPIAIELASEAHLYLIRGLAKVALRVAEHQATHFDEAFAELESKMDPEFFRQQLETAQAEHEITREGIQAQFFGQALAEVQMATSIIDAIDRAG